MFVSELTDEELRFHALDTNRWPERSIAQELLDRRRADAATKATLRKLLDSDATSGELRRAIEDLL